MRMKAGFVGVRRCRGAVAAFAILLGVVEPLIAQSGPSSEVVEDVLLLKGFRVEVTTAFSAAEIDELLAPFVGKSIQAEDLGAIPSAIIAAHRQRGLVASASLPPQEVTDGIVTIQVVEARFESVEVLRKDGSSHFLAPIVETCILVRLPKGSLIRSAALKEAELHLDDAAGVKAKAALKPGSAEGLSKIVITLENPGPLSGSFGMDNSGSLSTGSFSVSTGLSFSDLFGLGEKLATNLSITAGTESLSQSLDLPLGPFGTAANGSVGLSTYSLGGDFAALSIEGDTLSLAGDLKDKLLAGGSYLGWRPVSMCIDSGYDAKTLLAQGVNLADLVKAGTSPAKLIEAGYRIDQLLAGGLTLKDLKAAGYADKDLYGPGVSWTELKAAMDYEKRT